MDTQDQESVFGTLAELMKLFKDSGFGKQQIQRINGAGRVLQLIGMGTLTQAQIIEALTEQDKVNLHAHETTPQPLIINGQIPTPVDVQLEKLSMLFPALDASHVMNIAATLEVGNGGIYVVPKITSLARVQGIQDPFGQGYISLLIKAPRFEEMWHYRPQDPLLRPQRIKLSEEASNALTILERKTAGDYLVIRATLWGIQPGDSPRNAVWKARHSNQNMFPLPMLLGCYILYTNPQILPGKGLPDICFPGDVCRIWENKFNPNSGVNFRATICYLNPALCDVAPDEPGDYGNAFGFLD